MYELRWMYMGNARRGQSEQRKGIDGPLSNDQLSVIRRYRAYPEGLFTEEIGVA